MAGLNNHLRDLLVSRDEATVKLLETSPSIRQRYREQAVKASLQFIYEALDIGSQCMFYFKASKNQRLHVELALLCMCNLSEATEKEEIKKKAEPGRLDEEEHYSVAPPRSIAPPRASTVRTSQEASTARALQEASTARASQEASPSPAPATQKPKSPVTGDEPKKVSIKSIIEGAKSRDAIVSEPQPDAILTSPDREFTTEEFHEVWTSFAEEIREESPRISVTLSSVTPELLADKTILLKLDNLTLKESFDDNFRHRLEGHLRQTLRNGSIRLQTIVEATDRGEILYSPEQKFNHLAEKNPALRELKKTFNLDFE